MSPKRFYFNGKTVVHFLCLLTDEEYDKCNEIAKSKGDVFTIDTKYKFAIGKAKPFGGKKFHNKKFGGGIAFDSDQDLNLMLNKL